LPEYFEIYKEITDQEEYQAHTLASKQYEMSKEDKLNTSSEANSQKEEESKSASAGLIDTK